MATAITNMTKMAETDKVDAFIGPFASFFLDAARGLAEKEQIPMVGRAPHR